MRISGGAAKGRMVRLKKAFVKKGDATELRPTSAKVRQAIFNILGDRIINAAFLDLYAGTGAVGIEALSRGAKEVVFVDAKGLRVNTIKELLEKLSFKGRARVVKDIAANFVKKSESAFDIIFVDPPYASEELDTILSLIDDRSILEDNGVVIAEHSSKKAPPFTSTLEKEGIRVVGSLRLIKTYKYGDTSLSLYKKD
jgi:16S rRNA (guanine(966)-N(2))-methyltransferase RsmD